MNHLPSEDRMFSYGSPQLYEGTKRLHAVPMSRGDYNHLREWVCPADEDPTDLGYLVQYENSGASNVEGFKGYVSWSPKEVFEEAYYQINLAEPNWKDRIATEYLELEKKRKALNEFAFSSFYDSLSPDEQTMLTTQEKHMREYSQALMARIKYYQINLEGINH